MSNCEIIGQLELKHHGIERGRLGEGLTDSKSGHREGKMRRRSVTVVKEFDRFKTGRQTLLQHDYCIHS